MNPVTIEFTSIRKNKSSSLDFDHKNEDEG